MDWTEERVRHFLSEREQFNQHVEAVAHAYAMIKGKPWGSGRANSLDFDWIPDKIEVSWEDPQAREDPDSLYIELPIDLLWRLDWEEPLRRQVEEERRLHAERKQAEECRHAEETEVRERAQLARLKQKFEEV